MLMRATIAMAVLLPALAAGQTRTNPPVPTEYAGVTTNLTPGSGNRMLIQVFHWSSEDDRGRVLSVLHTASAEEKASPDLTKQLESVPTAGHIWTDAPVGYSVKYTHRVVLPDGGERILLVTDRPLGAWDRPGPWKADGHSSPGPFTVVELHLDKDGKGEGKMSLAAPFTINQEDRTLSLSTYERAPVTLKDVERKPKPYWAREE